MKHRPLLGIDASRSVSARPTGVERYSTEIIGALLKGVLETKSDFEIRLYTPRVISGLPVRLQRVLWFPRLWSLVRLSWEMLWHKPDLLFVPAHVLPFFSPRRSFVTVHDAAFLKVPSAYGFWQRWYLKWSTRRAVRRCEVVFVPSEAVKDDLVKLFEARNVAVVPHGPLNLVPVKVARSRIPLFFFLGRLEAKKNLAVLLKAWKIVQKKCSPGARLVLAGGMAKGFEKVKAEGVEYPGFVSEEEASRLFHSATAFVFPSLEEGFGLPLLQAFSADCPVICSDISALREVGGDAALYFEATDPEGLAGQMLKVDGDAGLRANLVKEGRTRLKAFSWEKAGRELIRIFKG